MYSARLMKEARGKWKLSCDYHLPTSKSSALKQLSFIAISRGAGARPVESCYRDLGPTDHPLTPAELVWGRCVWLYSRKMARLSLNTHDTWCRDCTLHVHVINEKGKKIFSWVFIVSGNTNALHTSHVCGETILTAGLVLVMRWRQQWLTIETQRWNVHIHIRHIHIPRNQTKDSLKTWMIAQGKKK